MPSYNPVVQGIQGKVTEPEYVDTRINLDLSGLKNLGAVFGNIQREEATYEAKLSQAIKQNERDALDLQLKLNREARAQESHDWAREKFNFAINAEQRAQESHEWGRQKFGVAMEEAERKKRDWIVKDAAEVASMNYSRDYDSLIQKAMDENWSAIERQSKLTQLRESYFRDTAVDGRPVIGYDDMQKIERGYTGLSLSDEGFFLDQQRKRVEEAYGEKVNEEKQTVKRYREQDPNNSMTDNQILSIAKSVDKAYSTLEYTNRLQDMIGGPLSPELEIARNSAIKNLGVSSATFNVLSTLSKDGMVNETNYQNIYAMTLKDMVGNGLNMTEATTTTNRLFDIMGLKEANVKFVEKRRAIEAVSLTNALDQINWDDIPPEMVESLKRYFMADTSKEEKAAILQGIVSANQWQKLQDFSTVLSAKISETKQAMIDGDEMYKKALDMSMLKVKGGTADKDDKIVAQTGTAVASQIGVDEEVNANNYEQSVEISKDITENHDNELTPDNRRVLNTNIQNSTASQATRTQKLADEMNMSLKIDENGYLQSVQNPGTTATITEAAYGDDLNNSVGTMNKAADVYAKNSVALNPGTTEEESRKKFFRDSGFVDMQPDETSTEAQPGFISGIRSFSTAAWQTLKSFWKHPKLASLAGKYIFAELSPDKETIQNNVIREAEAYYNSLSPDKKKELDEYIRKGSVARKNVEENEKLMPVYGIGKISGHPIAAVIGGVAYDLLPKPVKEALNDSSFVNLLGDAANILAGDPTYNMSYEDRAAYLTFVYKLNKFAPDIYKEVEKTWGGVADLWKNKRDKITLESLKSINSKQKMRKFYQEVIGYEENEDEKLYDYLKEKGIEQPIINPIKITNLEDKKLIADAIVTGDWNDDVLEVLNKYK